MTVFAWILLISCCCHLAATIVTSIFDDDVPGMIVGILASLLAGLFLAVYLFIAPLGVVWTGIAIGIAALAIMVGAFCEGLYTKFVGFLFNAVLIVIYILLLCKPFWKSTA